MITPQSDRIIININHDLRILQLIHATIPFIPGWQVGSNAYPSNPYWKGQKNGIPVFFMFDFNKKVFEWFGKYALDDKIIPIRDEAIASVLLDTVYLVATSKDPLKALAKLKRMFKVS